MNIKSFFTLLLAVLCTIFICSCNGSDEPLSARDDLSAKSIAEPIERSLANNALLEPASQRYIKANVTSESISDSAIEYVVKTSLSQVCDEYGVFKAKDAANASELCDSVNRSLDRRRESWDGRYYSEDESKILAARAMQFGRYVVYGVLDPDELELLFETAKSIIYQSPGEKS